VQSLQVIVPLVVPVITALVGALSLVVKDRRAAHDRRTVRASALAEATAEVAFAREWWTAHQALGTGASADANQRALALLASAEAKVASVQAMPAEEHDAQIFDRLFLFRRLEGRQAKALKVCFWIAIAFVAIGAIAISSDAAAGGDHSAVGSDAVLGLVCLLLVPVFHEAAEAADRRARREQPPAPPPVGAVSAGSGGRFRSSARRAWRGRARA
jgi:hypothetical protein